MWFINVTLMVSQRPYDIGTQDFSEQNLLLVPNNFFPQSRMMSLFIRVRVLQMRKVICIFAWSYTFMLLLFCHHLIRWSNLAKVLNKFPSHIIKKQKKNIQFYLLGKNCSFLCFGKKKRKKHKIHQCHLLRENTWIEWQNIRSRLDKTVWRRSKVCFVRQYCMT